MAFHTRVQEVERVVFATPLNILVWGPGVGGRENSEKRIKVKAVLKSHFPGADVAFSEDLSDVPSWGAELAQHERELWHLTLCDVCIVLDTSKGAGEEIAHFTATRLARKLFILTDEKYRGVSTFPAELRRHENQVFYTASEFETCTLITRIVNRVKHVALGKAINLLV